MEYYWVIVILFIAWGVVATSLTIFLVWEGVYGTKNTKDDIEHKAILEHFMNEEKKSEF